MFSDLLNAHKKQLDSSGYLSSYCISDHMGISDTAGLESQVWMACV